jgi:hypothetical protein
MIVPNHQHEQWDWQEYGDAAPVTVFSTPATRTSEVLAPDGEPLEVGYERPAVGFDLRRRK